MIRWEHCLGDVCKLVRASIRPTDLGDTLFAHYSIPAFDDGQVPTIEPGATILSNKIPFPREAVLFSKLNPRRNRVWFVNDDHQYPRVCSTEFLPLIPDRSIVTPRFLFYVLQEPSLVSRLQGRVAAATKSRERLKPEQVLAMEVPMPSILEQKHLVAALDDQLREIERARTAAEARLEAAKKLSSACLRSVFASKTVQSFPRVRLGDLLDLRKEVVHPHDKPEGREFFVGMEHIETGSGRRFGSLEVEMSELTGRKPRFQKGDVVYGYLRPYLNKVWVAEFDGLCSVDQYVYRVHRARTFPEFIAWFMLSPVYAERAPVDLSPGQLPRIRTEEVASVEINLPPLQTQEQILGWIRDQQGHIAAITTAVDKGVESLSSLPANLLRQAFSFLR